MCASNFAALPGGGSEWELLTDVIMPIISVLALIYECNTINPQPQLHPSMVNYPRLIPNKGQVNLIGPVEETNDVYLYFKSTQCAFCSRSR